MKLLILGAIALIAIVAGLDGPSRTVVADPIETPDVAPLPEREAPERAPEKAPVEPEKVPA